MKIEDGKLVTFDQRIVSAEDHEELFTSRQSVLFKSEPTPNKLYDAIKQKTPGEKVSVKFSIDELGSYDANKVVTIPRAQLRGVDSLKEGMVFKSESDGHTVLSYVTKIEPEQVTLDTNNILLIVNKDVIFEIDILAVEEPCTEITSSGNFHTVDLVLPEGQLIRIS